MAESIQNTKTQGTQVSSQNKAESRKKARPANQPRAANQPGSANQPRPADQARPVNQPRPKKSDDEMRESRIENAFVRAVKKEGGLALKFTSQTMNGVPDRLVLFKLGKCAFVELKAPGKQMRPLQRKRRKQLESLGFPVFCIDSYDQIDPVIKALKEWNPGELFPAGVGARIPDIEEATLPNEEMTLPAEEGVTAGTREMAIPAADRIDADDIAGEGGDAE